MHEKAAKNEINSKKKYIYIYIYVFIYIFIYIYLLDPKQVTNCQALQLESFANYTTKLGKRINCMLRTV